MDMTKKTVRIELYCAYYFEYGEYVTYGMLHDTYGEALREAEEKMSRYRSPEDDYMIPDYAIAVGKYVLDKEAWKEDKHYGLFRNLDYRSMRGYAFPEYIIAEDTKDGWKIIEKWNADNKWRVMFQTDGGLA